MQTALAPTAATPGPRNAALIRLLFVSDVLFVREALADILERDPSIAVVRCGDPIETAALDLTSQVDAVLVHTALRDGLDVARRLHGVVPHLPLIAFPLHETDADVCAWAEAGATGYIPANVQLDQFVDVLKGILSGEQLCSARVAAALLRRIRAIKMVSAVSPQPTRPLTRRERQVADLVVARLDDKEIAQYLNVGLATVKSHVHSVLKKLSVRRRRDVVEALRGQPPAWLV